MNWGKSIVLVFVLFAIFIGTLVVVCVRQNIELVSPDYYNKELQYQKEIERERNAASLRDKPEITSDGPTQLMLQFEELPFISNGLLTLYSPNDLKNDRSYPLIHSPGKVISIATGSLASGKYTATFTFSMNGLEYQFEQLIII